MIQPAADGNHQDLRADTEVVSVAACKDAGALAFVTSAQALSCQSGPCHRLSRWLFQRKVPMKVLGDRDVIESVSKKRAETCKTSQILPDASTRLGAVRSVRMETI